MINKGISIILCVYNGGKILPESLKYLTRLDINALQAIEMIFVDNNSTDNSCEIIKDCLKEFTVFPWKIVKEPQSGLTYARLKGISEAKYDIMLFCDQDNLLASNYLTVGVEIMDKDPMIAVLGGKGTAESDIPLPEWFKAKENFYAVGAQMPQSGLVRGQRNVVYGAGMFVRKSAFTSILNNGFRFFNMSRSGKKLYSGEDSEMCLALRIAGYKIWYDTRLEFIHFIDSQRLTRKYFKKLVNGIMQSGFISKFYFEYIYGYTPKVSRYFWLKELLYTLKELLISLYNKNYRSPRNRFLILFLLKERAKYNDKVRKIISICETLDSQNRNKVYKQIP